ncbi:ADAMTS-like protein 1 [Hypsibius exemplaris]|uniref:ADAMTS-like protein 1 n=1 Tax=Hypsibius exemplaris TaxID=2072580 RepID=A0A1W0WJV7_HYPEX|nr:ADAMTS-like protein 1 [Hypsibius exemplaris]
MPPTSILVRLLLMLVAVLFYHCVVPLAGAKLLITNSWDSSGPSNSVAFNDRNQKSLADTIDWSSWSNWSECSKTCDGGATFQYRQCKENIKCNGPKIRYKLCNTQPCSEGVADFRGQQCAAYNNIPLKGQLYKWSPHLNPKKLCALVCRGQSQDESILRELAPKVLDGTRCREGSLDMCINGVCMPVGCDLTLGSTLRLDACGVCGGDGRLCGRVSAYRWHYTNYSDCSRPCGGGHQGTSVVCRDSERNEVVEDRLCESTPRLLVQMRECNQQSCHSLPSKHKSSKSQLTSPSGYHMWSVESWGPCTADCNGGDQARRVFCMRLLSNSTKQPVGDFHCTKTTQPATDRRCNLHACPQWQTSSWSPCSATCGRGTQTRTVKCVDHKGYDDAMQCEKTSRPSDKKVCKVSPNCVNLDTETTMALPWDVTVKPEDPFDLPHSEQALPLVAPNPYQWNEQTVGGEDALKFEDTPMFATGAWSECSATCGHGYRYRSVECKLYIKFSVKLVQLPDSECSDTRPNDREPCTRRPCGGQAGSDSDKLDNSTNNLIRASSNDLDIEKTDGTGVDVTYSWHYQGYTTCTRTCLGGVRHAVIHCFRDHDQSPVDEKHCKTIRRPPELKQSCNDVPCPPRWNISDSTPCSHTCGGGFKTRTVQCVQEFGSDPGDLLTMPTDSCPYPPPRTQLVCNPTDCPASWDLGQWSSCSKTCGKGLMERQVICRQRMASGDVRDIIEGPDAVCPKPKPSTIKSCHVQSCSEQPTEWRGVTKPSKFKPSTKPLPVTLNVSRGKAKASQLKVGGSAVLYEGTDLRLKCPVFVVPNHPRPLVKWLKDGRPMVFSKSQKAHKKMSAFGAVKIKSLRRADAGTYTCIAGRTRETIHLTVIRREDSLGQNQAPTQTSNRPLFIGSNSNSNTIQRFYANSTDALRILQTVSQKTTLSPFTSNAIDFDEDDFRATPDQMKRQPEVQDRLESTTSRYYRPDEDENKRTNLQQGISKALALLRRSPDDLEHFVVGRLQMDKSAERMIISSPSGGHKLVFEWKTGEWGPCSRRCGGDGSQTRSVECAVQLDGQEEIGGADLCSSVGLLFTIPPLLQFCGWSECPEWRTDAWNPCEKSECFALNTAVQTRNVTCIASNGSTVAQDDCLADSRPRDKRDCVNYKCKAVWTTGPWSECTVSCGRNGIRSRLLKCVWYGSSRPAGNMCRSLDRPPVKESCEETAKCPAEPPCRDHFKYCDYANSLKLCKQKAYRLRCCRTCSSHPSVR